MVKTGAQIEDAIAKKYEQVYKTLNQGFSRAINSWIILREATLKALKGLFSADELDHLIKISKGIKYDPYYAIMTESLLLRLRQNPKDEVLKIKLEALDNAQAMILSDWIDAFNTKEKRHFNKEQIQEWIQLAEKAREELL